MTSDSPTNPAATNAGNGTALLWLRRDLRLFDHAALYHALASRNRVLCVFVLDTEILEKLPRTDRRVAFIHASLLQIQQQLRALGSDLMVRHGRAPDQIIQLAKQTGATAVFANRDYEPSAILRDETVAARLADLGVALHLFKDQVIFEQDEILNRSAQMYQVFTPYKNAWLARVDDAALASWPIRLTADQLYPCPPVDFPTLDQLGFAAIDISALKPGMDGGEILFDDFRDRISLYRAARDFPAKKGVSYLSVHLRFGTVSVRELARFAWQVGGEGAETWLSELIWREFYQQLLWHRPEVVAHAFRPEYDRLPFPNDRNWFEAWCHGQTGFPIVDAAMRQLNQTGFMHNRLRMIAASFLVKDLLIDWRWGEQYFAAQLNDFDLAANNGGWQWAASTGCDAQPYFRIFNPTTQSQRFDPEGNFIRRYCPELAHLDNKAIHCPPPNTPGYPLPLVEHDVQRQAALALYKLR